MKQLAYTMLSIFSGLAALMVAGAIVEGGALLPLAAALGLCLAATRGFYRLSLRQTGHAPTKPSLRVAKKAEHLRAA